jgi:hypothetical protein
MSERAVATAKASETKQTCSNSCKQNVGLYSSGSTADMILQLQRTAGNQAVQRLIKSRTLQTKLRIDQPNDVYEQEADRVAEQVMGMPLPVLQRKCAKCEDEKKALQAKELPGKVPVAQGQDVPPIVHEVLRSPGQSLDKETRALMEPRFGHDFSHVRVYTNTPAAKSAETVNAEAYTAGNHIVFGRQRYKPKSWEGLHLLAHELTHVIQQGTNRCAFIQRQVFPTSTNYRFDTYQVSEQDLSDPDIVTRFKSFRFDQLIQYRRRISDFAVIDFIDQLLNVQLSDLTLDQLFGYLATEKDKVVWNYIDQWLSTHAPTSFEFDVGKNKPGKTGTSMKVHNIDVKVLPDEFVDEPAFKVLEDEVLHGQVPEDTKSITVYDPKWHTRWIIKSGEVSSVQPTIQKLKIKTVVLKGTSRISQSKWGVGTRPVDVKTGKITLAHHEGSHASCFIQFLRDTAPPEFAGKKGDTRDKIEGEQIEFDSAMKRYYDNMKSLCGTSVDCTGKKASFCP